MGSFMISWSCLESAEEVRTLIIFSWETMSIEVIIGKIEEFYDRIRIRLPNPNPNA